MVTRISVDASQDAMIAKLWNSPAGRAAMTLDVEPDEVAMLVFLRMNDFPTDEERTALTAAIGQALAKIETVELLSEVRVPQSLEQRTWRLHVTSHLRADCLPPSADAMA